MISEVNAAIKMVWIILMQFDEYVRCVCALQISSSWRVRRRWWPVRVYLLPCVALRASRGVELCAFTPSCVTSLPPTR